MHSLSSSWQDTQVVVRAMHLASPALHFMAPLSDGLFFSLPTSSQPIVCRACLRCVLANFCHLTLSSVYWNQGLNFAKFFTRLSCLQCVLWLQSRSCFTAIFVTWLCRGCIGTRGLISLNFSCPGLVCYVFCSSRAEVVLGPMFVTWLLFSYGDYSQRFCPSDYIRHIHHAFIIIFVTRHTGCC